MSFKKPFRSTPVKLGPYYLAERRRRQRDQVVKVLAFAIIFGVFTGTSMGLGESGRWAVVSPVHEPNAAAEYFNNCSEVRAAGAAPLHRGEPGYRARLDRDGDGIACEPYRGG